MISFYIIFPLYITLIYIYVYCISYPIYQWYTASMSFHVERPIPKWPCCVSSFFVSLSASAVMAAPATPTDITKASPAGFKSWKMWAFIVDFPIKNGDFPIVMLVYQRVSSIVFFCTEKKASNIEIFCLKDWDFSIKHWDLTSFNHQTLGLKHQELGLSHQSAGVDIVSQFAAMDSKDHWAGTISFGYCLVVQQPSWKMMELVSWDDDYSQLNGNIFLPHLEKWWSSSMGFGWHPIYEMDNKAMFPTTNRVNSDPFKTQILPSWENDRKRLRRFLSSRIRARENWKKVFNCGNYSYYKRNNILNSGIHYSS